MAYIGESAAEVYIFHIYHLHRRASQPEFYCVKDMACEFPNSEGQMGYVRKARKQRRPKTTAEFVITLMEMCHVP